MLFSDSFFVTEEENFQILTIKTDQICERNLRHSLRVKNIVQRKEGKRKTFSSVLILFHHSPIIHSHENYPR